MEIKNNQIGLYRDCCSGFKCFLKEDEDGNLDEVESTLFLERDLNKKISCSFDEFYNKETLADLLEVVPEGTEVTFVGEIVEVYVPVKRGSFSKTVAFFSFRWKPANLYCTIKK